MADLSSLLGAQQNTKASNDHEISASNDEWARTLHILESYNGEMRSTWENEPSRLNAPRVSLAVSTDLKQWNYRYMFEKKGERSLGSWKSNAELDNRLDDMGEVLRQSFGIDTELEDPSIASQESIYCVGRICMRLDPESKNGSSSTNTRLNPSNLMIETSRMVGNGKRVILALDPSCRARFAFTDDTAQIASVVGLFPGMIVGARGRNGGGNRFVVEELLIPPALPHPATNRSELMHHQYGEKRLEGSPLRMMVSAGPFTDPQDLQFKPWHGFITHVETMSPDVLLLLGPFLSASHEKIVSGDIDDLPTSIFQRHISRRITRLMERSPGTTVILVPSTEDIVHSHFAYPQPFLNKNDASLGLPKRVRCLPNPCIFYVNELAIGVSTADVLGDLRREELVQRVQAAGTTPAGNKLPTAAANDARDPMLRLSRHVLSQRTFYPIFPPSSSSKLPLDLTHSRLCALDQVTPDLMILPSTTVKPFLRLVDSTMVVNCGALVGRKENRMPGTFVRMQISAMPRDSLHSDDQSADELVTHELYKRARIDLVQTN
ncbi:DNA-directed DNA polymerase alpha subunit pol12 [Malassezia psittaci]|uniref:DNA polymerase alpha subunit B n=1 Tax=Malassezia psittaci TaxID=1821823 RepID=A0AAF0JCN1_9BASI|nr:DNA-directed DNA polymerase alpha subunit pol12 [Malassezia psittaci]